MCAPITSMPGFKQISTLGGLLGDKHNPHMMASRALDSKIFGWNDQTKPFDPGTTRSSMPDGSTLFRGFLKNRGVGIGSRVRP